jgi:hypothetical protein
VKYSGGAPVRQPLPSCRRILRDAERQGFNSSSGVQSLKLLWARRRTAPLLSALLASTYRCFLIPARYESTSRLMPR